MLPSEWDTKDENLQRVSAVDETLYECHTADETSGAWKEERNLLGSKVDGDHQKSENIQKKEAVHEKIQKREAVHEKIQNKEPDLPEVECTGSESTMMWVFHVATRNKRNDDI